MKVNNKNLYFIVLYAVLFTGLAVSVRLGFTAAADRTVYLFLRRFDDFEWLDAYLTFLSHIFEPFYAVIIFLVVAVIYYFKKDAYFWLYATGAGFSLAAGAAMKYIFQRTRPEAGHIPFDGFSFPSMHVLSFFVLVILLFRISSNIYFRAVLVVLIISMMISRIYLGAHFLSDTIASIILVLLILHIQEFIKEKFMD